MVTCLRDGSFYAWDLKPKGRCPVTQLYFVDDAHESLFVSVIVKDTFFITACDEEVSLWSRHNGRNMDNYEIREYGVLTLFYKAAFSDLFRDMLQGQ